MQLLEALRREKLLSDNEEPDIPTLARAAHVFLARTRLFWQWCKSTISPTRPIR